MEWQRFKRLLRLFFGVFGTVRNANAHMLEGEPLSVAVTGNINEMNAAFYADHQLAALLGGEASQLCGG